MRNYSLLSDHDFEQLVADLLHAETGNRWETFARGRDGGIDLRSRSGGKVSIAQCKHMQGSTFSQLKTAAKKEADSLAKNRIKAANYLFFTTQSLTPNNKNELFGILAGWASNPSQMYGANDLEGLLNSHPEVERAHTKLWISGAGQLSAQLHSATWERSKQLHQEILEMIPRYVEISEFPRAKTLLAKHKVIVVAGPPGIGKTTLARLLIADSALQGFEPVQISSDINEGDETWDINGKQIFYYDDFLGETFLDDRLTKNEDKRISSFIRRCSRSATKLFVLTTREHILRRQRQSILCWAVLSQSRIGLF